MKVCGLNPNHEKRKLAVEFFCAPPEKRPYRARVKGARAGCGL